MPIGLTASRPQSTHRPRFQEPSHVRYDPPHHQHHDDLLAPSGPRDCLRPARSKTLELRLILIGVFTAIAAAVQGNVSAAGINPGNVAVSLGFSAGSLMKVAVILILSGVTLTVLDRTGRGAAAEPKEVSHGG